MTGFSEDPAPFGARLDKAAFFAWAQTWEGVRCELKDGHIVMHAGSSRTHARISTAIAAILHACLDPSGWMVTTADFAVQIGNDYRYPDVLVEPAKATAPDAMSTTNAVLLVEVLSPSSVDRDLEEKLAEYTSLPSLQCYIVASQDEPRVWVWQRDTVANAFPAQPDEIAGFDAAISVHELGILIPLAQIYRGILPGRTP